MWVKLPRALEELAAVRKPERLARQHQGHLLPGLRELGEHRERLVRRGGTDDLVTPRVAPTQLSLDRAKLRINVDGYERGE